jgi:glycosyltransferase involved in cell wall biosynthesis
MDDFRFSVLIPVYAKENPLFFKECLASMFRQTLLPDEVVVIEDGKLSRELDIIIDVFKREFPQRLRVFKIAKNVGMSNALNLALPTCPYPWIARMDSDDIAKEDRFEKQISFLRKNPGVNVLGTWIEEFEEDMKTSIAIRKVPQQHRAIYQYAKTRNPINHMTVIYQKDKALQVGGYPAVYGTSDDYGLWIYMLMAGCVFANLPILSVDARTGKGFLTRRSGLKYLEIERNFLKHLKQIGFYNRNEYLYNWIIRTSTRLMPKVVVKFIYQLIRKF